MSRFNVEAHDDGQVYVTEGREQRLHAQIHGEEDVEIQVLHKQRIQIEKLYGPLIMFPLRVWIDYETAEWVVEREFGHTGEHMDKGVKAIESEWRVVGRFPGQLAEDFGETGESEHE